MKKTFDVKGIHCASCINLIEKSISKVKGVESCDVSLASKKATIEYDESQTSPDQLNTTIKGYGYELLQHSDHNPAMGMPGHDHMKMIQEEDEKKLQRDVWTVTPMIIVVVLMMYREVAGKYGWMWIPLMPETRYEFFHHLLPIFATYTLFSIGSRYISSVWLYLKNGFRGGNMDTLVGIWSIVAFLYSFVVTAFEVPLAAYVDTKVVFYESVIVVIGFIAMGRYLEQKTISKTWAAIKKLMWLQSKNAIKIVDGKELVLPLDQVMIGDHLLVKPWEKIPVDGVVISWESDVDEAMITGESMPVTKQKWDTVIGATINNHGVLTIQATAVWSSTMLAKIIALVEQAQNSKTSLQRIVDKVSAIFIPVVVGIAILSLTGRLVIGTRYVWFDEALRFGIMWFIGVLVIACPCGLGLATPMAVMAWLGKWAEHGVLIKNADALQKLAKAKVIIFDKTGTITEGKPQLIVPANLSPEHQKNISLLYALEKNSSHPLAYAITEYAKKNNISSQDIASFKTVVGKGVQWLIDGVQYYAGNRSWATTIVKKWNTKFESQKDDIAAQGQTPIVLFTDDKIVDVYAIGDTIKATSRAAIQDLHKRGITTYMLTGDNHVTAQAIASQVGITHIIADVNPEMKEGVVQKIKQEVGEKNIVVMVWDGINDSPALARADVGIAMSHGTDVAIETADIVLLQGDLQKIVKAINISQFTITAIRQNLARAFSYNIIGIPLAAGLFYPLLWRVLNPVFAGAAMAFSDITVIANSLRLQAKKIS